MGMLVDVSFAFGNRLILVALSGVDEWIGVSLQVSRLAEDLIFIFRIAFGLYSFI